MPAHKKPRLNIACEMCGIVFQTLISTKRFCSYKCSNKHVVAVRVLPTRTLAEDIGRFWEQVNKTDGCWLWAGKLSGEYGRVYILGEYLKAHRFSYELHFGPIPDGQLACHECDNPLCVRPDHLFLGTHQDNADDMVRKGRSLKGIPTGRGGLPHPSGEKMIGEGNGNAKLTEDDVRYIRANYKRTGYKQSNSNELADQFNICTNTVLHIVKRKRWPHVQ